MSRQYVAKLFGDKEGLYVACHERARRQLDTALQGAGAAAPAAPASTDDALLETVRSVAEAYFRFVAEQGTSWDVLFGGGPGVAGAAAAKIADMRTRTIGLLVAFVTTAIPAVSDDDALFAAEAMSGAAEQHARRLRRDGEDPAASAQRLAELFYRGLAGLRS